MSARTINDLNNYISDNSKEITKAQNHIYNSFEISKGIILRVSEDRLKYQVQVPRSGITVYDVPLFLDKAYYQIIGFPNVGDVVKLFHQNNYSAAFIIARSNTLDEEIIMKKNSSIPKGANIP